MARDAEPDLHGLITARRAELELQAETLSQQLQEVPGELEELTVAERAARRLAEQLHAETRTTPGVPARSQAARCCWCRSASATAACTSLTSPRSCVP
ncbi:MULTISPECIES: hypothetical protein [unclassified Streptomyces]|uniref:Uncharacterized protein n=1 Tax=Streptomyces sp. NBC_00119 TaxID=2975659 RepID=A0AAU1UL78_9ACTN|nr:MULTISPECIES: hypothetical protein [unclassified Streptomyces]MCX4649664.1 hypothetical protein [Streptomyces sp. NBC_01446]MCX5321128.1 hypothetical protein [Streptomyces sp. NBC_00120]